MIDDATSASSVMADIDGTNHFYLEQCPTVVFTLQLYPPDKQGKQSSSEKTNLEHSSLSFDIGQYSKFQPCIILYKGKVQQNHGPRP